MPETPPYDMRSPMRSWYDLEHFMDGLAIFNLPSPIEPRAWPPPWTQSATLEAMVQDMKDAEKLHLADIEAAVALIAISGEVALEGFARETIRFLKFRSEAVSWFASQFVAGGSTVIPTPTAPMGEIVRWFLCEWWYEHGYVVWCDTWISEKWTNEEN